MTTTLTEGEREHRTSVMHKFRDWIKNQEMTQGVAADKLGVHPRFLRKLFAGQHAPNDAVLARIEKLMAPAKKLSIKKSKPIKKVAKLRAAPPKPGDLPFDTPATVMVPEAAKSLARRSQEDLGNTPSVGWSVVTPEEIETARARFGLSKLAMANRLGVTNSTYHNWLRGYAVPTVATQQRVTRSLQGSVEPSPQLRYVSPEVKAAAREATVQLVIAMIQSGQEMTQDELVNLTQGLMQEFCKG